MAPTRIVRARVAGVNRSGDRRVALLGIVLALAFLAAALVSLGLPSAARRGLWLPLHLALAGGASVAIAGVMPFFVAAFAAAQPANVWLRLAGILAIAGGAAGVATGVVAAVGSWVGPAGGLVFVGGVVLTGAATVRPLAGSLGPGRGIVTQAYLAALAAVTLGATLGTLDLAGWRPVVEAWARVRPAHAWLNLVGFVSLVIATTLLHFFPTVVGGRIVAHPSARVTVFGVGGGSIAVAAGYLFGLDVIVRLGAALAILGALALLAYAYRTWTARARWTTDLGWHRFAIGGLASAIGWFAVGIAILGGRAVSVGGSTSGWSVEPVVAPLVVGWIGQAIIASATHLVPSVGPGDQAAHARQRSILAVAPTARLIAANGGVAGIWVGSTLGVSELAVAGVAVTGLAFGATTLLLFRAIGIGMAPAT